MKPLVGLLLVISGTILAIPPLYQVLSYLEYEDWPIVQVILGITCIAVGLIFLMYKKQPKRVLTEVG